MTDEIAVAGGGPTADRVWIRTAVILSVIVWLIGLAPLLFPEARLWGVNHLLFLPQTFTIIYVGVGLLALLGFIPAVSRRLLAWFDAIGGLLFETQGLVRWGLVGLGAMALFWLLRMPTYLLGDGYPLIQNVAGELPVVFKWSEIGAVRVVHLVAQLIPMHGWVRGEYAYAIVSVLAGALTTALLCGIAFELGRDRVERLWIWLLPVCSGWILLFFGYAENYPMLWPVMAGYVYFGLRYLHRKGGLLIPAIFLLAALVLHLQSAFFCISFAALATARGPLGRFYKRHRRQTWMLAGLGVVIGAVLFVWLCQTSLSFRIHFMPLFEERPPVPGYTVFSLSHLADIGNELLLTIPLFPVLLVLVIRRWRTGISDIEGSFLSLFALGGILLLFMIEPKLGMGRDWDLFALIGLAGGLLLARTAAAFSYLKHLFPVLAILSAVLAFPYLVTNLQYQPSIDYYEWLLRLDQPRSRPGLVILRDFYEKAGDTLRLDSLSAKIAEHFPLATLVPRAYALATEGHLVEAMQLADSIYRLDPYSHETLNLRGTIYSMMGDYERAIPDFEQAVRFQPYQAKAMANLAQAYQRVGRNKDVLRVLRRAQKYSPDLPLVLEGLGSVFYLQQQYDSAFVYGQRLINVSPAQPRGYLVAGFSAYHLGNHNTARAYLTRFLEMAAVDDPESQQARNILEQIQRKD